MRIHRLLGQASICRPQLLLRGRFAALLSMIILVVCLGSAGTRSAQADRKSPGTPADVQAALGAVIRAHYPAAEISVTEKEFSAKARTMLFTLHDIARDGAISEETHPGEGPRRDGFILKVSYSEGRYGGPLVTPQTLRDPYWSTFVNDIPRKESGTHL